MGGMLRSGVIRADKLKFQHLVSASGWEKFCGMLVPIIILFVIFCLCALCCCRCVFYYLRCGCFCGAKKKEKKTVVLNEPKAYSSFIPEKKAGATTTAPTTVMETGPIIQPMTPEPMTAVRAVEAMSIEPMSLGIEAMEIPNSEDPMQLTSIKVEPTTVTPQNEAVLGDLSAVEPMTTVPVTEASDSTSSKAGEDVADDLPSHYDAEDRAALNELAGQWTNSDKQV